MTKSVSVKTLKVASVEEKAVEVSDEQKVTKGTYTVSQSKANY